VRITEKGGANCSDCLNARESRTKGVRTTQVGSEKRARWGDTEKFETKGKRRTATAGRAPRVRDGFVSGRTRALGVSGGGTSVMNYKTCSREKGKTGARAATWEKGRHGQLERGESRLGYIGCGGISNLGGK